MSPEQELDLRMSEPEPGSIIRLTASYPESPKSYTYAAVEAGGMWYITGYSGEGRTWDTLISWLKSRKAEITSLSRAESWEDIL